MDLIGEMGGVIEIIVIIFGVIIYPISKQSFILKATSKLFKARTTDDDIFKKPKINQNDRVIDLEIQNEV
jgi:hypothetical protein